ncbi:DMT family transporter [Pseudolysinimonas sp.]|uniref:DMT family transporter n=1 Tax=Pseudolysinimonas sp. TaxID=2680009 RepID=UPI00286B3A10|nr:DMT family transporter [Pseudolysinimonas sp.]
MIEIGDVDAQSIIGNIPVVGILIALVGAVFLSLGAQFQHRGVEVVEERHGSGNKAGLSVGQLLRLLARPSWVIGTVLLGLAILFQLTSLGFAPLIVVQPIGAVALVITAIVNARVTKTKIEGPVLRAIALCVGGIALFVTVATFVAEEQVIGETQLVIVLSILGGVILMLALTFAFARKRAGALFYIVAAGVLYGFVATLAKVVINRVGNLMAGIVGGEFEWLTIACVVALLIAAALGAYFVQTAYSLGSPDLVIAGLTVVDPLLAVAIGIAVLGEAAHAPLWVIPVWALAASVAVYGVYQLAKHHPQTHR